MTFGATRARRSSAGFAIRRIGNTKFVFVDLWPILAVMLIALAGLVLAGCDSGPTSPSPGGGTAEIQRIQMITPNGGVIEKGQIALLTVWLLFDGMSDSEYVGVVTAVSQERDVLTHGFGGQWVRRVGDWRQENPATLAVGVSVRQDTTFSFVHVLVFRGFPPSAPETKPPILISALRNVLSHQVLEWEVTFLRTSE
ncbi:MAG: hypothetical protein A2918_02245 [Candidatus Yanofskybacteria bacterium RIFCSPLOWO2_01_FULL_42_49]|uniref:Uncharacterized protein n=1 Tax=Candidatus Yanofskybacteria bacterium RIFCSPLOWO2_01_FULL_42_49 TaxID=1802694 RepID=A0A1F8GDL9_9BACT|nr:MAG: hypothetical protein A2918_02245 [Candidatus Yanofskybacteria bacterium RIFCSPLOWO2_01_FULL_42_49]